MNELPITMPVMIFMILTIVAVAIGLEQLTAHIWPPTGMLSYCCC